MSDILSRLAGQSVRTVTTVGDRAAVRVTRPFATDVDDLWEAWTDPDRLARWLGVISGERREGGALELCMRPPDRDIARLVVMRCDRPHRLVVGWSWPGEPDSIVDLRLVADGPERSVLTLEHLQVADPTAVQYGSGWEDLLSHLSAALAGDDPAEPAGTDVDALLQPHWAAARAASRVDDRWPTIETGADGRVIRAGHTVPVPPGAVWAAFTTPEALRWFGAVTGDLVVGGDWSVTWDGGRADGTVVECQPDRRLVTTWRWAHEPPEAPVGTVTVTLTPDGAGTRIELVHDHVGEAVVGYGAGWYSYLLNLDASLTGRPRNEADWQVDFEIAMAVLRR
jgi:uncharacterized protein YndB with AHSA1/START domain